MDKQALSLATKEAVQNKRPSGMAGVVHDVQQALDDQNEDVSERERNRRLMVSLKPTYEQAVRPVGRPALYTEDMPRIVYELFTRFDAVLTKKAIAAHLGVDESTLRRWREEHPELKAAITQGMAVQETYLASKMADGLKYSQSLYAVLKNLHMWSDRTEETDVVDLREAMLRQSQSAKRVIWDKPKQLSSGHAGVAATDGVIVEGMPSSKP